MKTFNVYEAKTHFSKLLDLVSQGEQVVIAKNGKPFADLTPHKTKGKVRLGAWKRNPDIMIPDDFDDPDPEIMAMFENSKIFPDGVL